MSLTLAPVPRQQYVDSAGVPYAGGYLYTYQAGTSTPEPTYNDVNGLIPNANPMRLDASGRPPAMFLLPTSYKFMLTDVNDVTIWTQDNVGAVGLQSASLGQGFALYGDPTSPVVQVAYPSGATYDKLQAGTAILKLDSGNLNGTYGLQGMLRGAGGTITAGLFNLSDGSPDVAMIEISSNDANGVPVVSAGITFPAAGSTKSYGVKTKVSAGTGWGWAFALVRLS